MKITLKKILLLALFSGPFNLVLATEGLWLPNLLSGLVEADMQSMGMELSAEDIYSINQGSLKDAVVNFGGGCTGSVISPDGLLLTNHHCGYSTIQKHSSVENDMLTNGFWSGSRQDELSNPGLKVYFIKRIDDVTAEILDQIGPEMPEVVREELIQNLQNEMIKKVKDSTGYEAVIKPFFYGNSYYMFTMEVFTDIRLVAAPPSSIGKFGGETDNWMWPRHTGDFSLFRIYTAPDGSPAEYAPENIPMQADNYLRVTLEGVNPGDFTMVFGFPGRTQEYLTASAVRQTVEILNPHRIDIREKKLAVLAETMKKSDALRIQYAADYARIANYYKKWQGENWGLNKYNAIEKKELSEAAFKQWLKQDPKSQSHYGGLIQQIDSTYQVSEMANLYRNYLNEAIYGIESMRFARNLSNLKKDDPDELAEELTTRLSHFKSYDFETDKELFVTLFTAFVDNMDPDYYPDFLKKALNRYDNNISEWAEDIYKDSYLTSSENFQDLIDSRQKQLKQNIESDPMLKLDDAFIQLYRNAAVPVLYQTSQVQDSLYRIYIRGLQSMNKDARFYPDANSTMRVSYGQVEGCEPQDGMSYKYLTTLEGVMQKEDLDNPEFTVPEKLKQLYLTRDYGAYDDEEVGVMPVCFLASNHTTGGNSGSPVINGRGELIGLNFDRSWESTMSDMYYDPDICRNIAVDIRYILFIIDKFGGAGHLVDEMMVDETMEVEMR